MPLSPIGRKERLEHGMQTRIAGRFKVSDEYVSRVVGGERQPKTKKGWERYNRVQRYIAEVLGVPVEEAFSATERGVSEPGEVFDEAKAKIA